MTICLTSMTPINVMNFFLCMSIVSFSVCLCFHVAICPTFPLRCSSLTGDMHLGSCLVMSARFLLLLSNSQLRMTLQYIELWQLLYAISPFSCLSFSQSDSPAMSGVSVWLITSIRASFFHSILTAFTCYTQIAVVNKLSSVMCKRAIIVDGYIDN